MAVRRSVRFTSSCTAGRSTTIGSACASCGPRTSRGSASTHASSAAFASRHCATRCATSSTRPPPRVATPWTKALSTGTTDPRLSCAFRPGSTRTAQPGMLLHGRGERPHLGGQRCPRRQPRGCREEQTRHVRRENRERRAPAGRLRRVDAARGHHPSNRPDPPMAAAPWDSAWSMISTSSRSGGGGRGQFDDDPLGRRVHPRPQDAGMLLQRVLHDAADPGPAGSSYPARLDVAAPRTGPHVPPFDSQQRRGHVRGSAHAGGQTAGQPPGQRWHGRQRQTHSGQQRHRVSPPRTGRFLVQFRSS